MLDQQPELSNTAITAPRFAIGENVARTMSSREIAFLTGKRHDHVVRDIEKMLVELGEDVPSFGGIYFDGMNRRQTEYLLDEEHTICLTSGYSVNQRMAIIRELKSNRPSMPAVLPSYAETLRLYADQIEETQRVTAERDTAIATKALIGSKREATAMATASSAVKKASQLANELGRGSRQATMIAVEKANDCTYGKQGFRPLKKWCKANGVTVAKVPCPRYGEASAWPAGAWFEVYGVDLAGLFGGVAE